MSLLLNGKQLRQNLGISSTVFYKMKKAGMPYHQFPAGRAYYLLDEVTDWLKVAGYHQQQVLAWKKNK